MALPTNGNGLTIAAGTADLEIYDGFGTWGFRYTSLSRVSEKRGDGFAGQVASGGQNYDDATPFKRKVYDNFLGGLGQVSDNKVSGGVGIGGDDTKFFFGDAMTERAGYLLPGMSRNMIYNTVANKTLPVQGDNDNRAGDEYEVPRGVLPCALSPNYSLVTNFTAGPAGFTGVTQLRCLINLQNPFGLGSFTVRAAVYTGGVLVGTFTKDLAPSSSYQSYNGWTWINLVSAAVNFAANQQFDIFFDCDTSLAPPVAAIGCYINHPANSYGNANNLNIIKPYFQICKPGTATPYKLWASPLRRVHQLLNGTTYVNVAVMNTAWLNTAVTNSGGTTPANSPEVTLTGTYTSSIVWNNKLYVATTSGLTGWSVAQVAANSSAAPTNPLDVGAANAGSLLSGYGKIYYTDTSNTRIVKWDGNFPISASLVVGAGTIGDANSAITKIFFYQGNLWAAKPEGLFLLYGDPVLMGSSATYTPRITPMGDPFPTPHQSAGAYTVVHQGTIYTNYKDRLYAITVSATGTQVAIATVPMPWYRLGNYHQIDGIASDGVNLYVSFNNLGVFNYLNQTWHLVTELYETISSEPTNSGLTWVVNPTGGLDNLYVRDGFSLLQIPRPSAVSPYTKQMSLADQNKCGYLITSATNFEAASMKKYVIAAVLSALPAGFSFLVRPVISYKNPHATTIDPLVSFSSLTSTTWMEGLIRDSWMNPNMPNTNFKGVSNTPMRVASTSFANFAAQTFAGTAPTYWTSLDFPDATYASEKVSYLINPNAPNPLDDALKNPANFIQTQFIIYFWNPVAIQAAQSGADIMAIDSVDIKYQTIQNYLALYKVSLSVASLTEGRSVNLGAIEAETTWEYLRSQLGRHSVVLVTIKVREQTDPAVPAAIAGLVSNTKTRSFLAFLQNPTDEYGNPIVNLDTNQPLATRLDLDIIAAFGEYPNV